MKMGEKIKKINISHAGIKIIFILLMVLIISCKRNMHVDEIYSYGLSNHLYDGEIQMTVTDGEQYIPAEQPWLDYITVQKIGGGQFNYANVWRNQEIDVHPPFYYAVLHTISSIFPGKYSIWFAAAINIVFAVLTLEISRKLCNILCDDKKVTFLFSIYFILSAGILSAVTFMRMYIMAMFWITLITYLFVKSVKNGLPVKTYIAMSAVAVIGTLTHYYFVVYLVLLCMVMETWLIWKKRIMDAIILLLSMSLSGGIAILVFPSMLKHVFGGYRGEQSFENLKTASINEYVERIKKFYEMFDKQLFGGILTFLIFFAVMIMALCCVEQKHLKERIICYCSEKNEAKVTLIEWMLTSVPSIVYFLLISKIAVFVADRYIHPIYAVSMVGVFASTYGFTKVLAEKKNRKIIMSICLSIFIVGSWKECEWTYLYRDSSKVIEKAKEYGESRCVAIYDQEWHLQPSFYEMREYSNVVCLNEKNLAKLITFGLEQENNFVVYITNSSDSETILKTIEDKCPLINQHEKIGSYGYMTGYRMYGKGINEEQCRIYDYEHQKVLGRENKQNENPQEIKMMEKDNSFIFAKENEEEYITIFQDNMAIDICDGKMQKENNIQFFFINNTEAQKWKISNNADGTVTIFSKNPNLVMTRMSDGTVCLGEYREGDVSQKWWMEKCEK